MEFIVIETEDGKIEMPIDNDDGTIACTTVLQFGGGLKYLNEETGNYRLLKMKNGKIFPPPGGWEAVNVYEIAVSKLPKQPPPAGAGNII